MMQHMMDVGMMWDMGLGGLIAHRGFGEIRVLPLNVRYGSEADIAFTPTTPAHD